MYKFEHKVPVEPEPPSYGVGGGGGGGAGEEEKDNHVCMQCDVFLLPVSNLHFRISGTTQVHQYQLLTIITNQQVPRLKFK